MFKLGDRVVIEDQLIPQRAITLHRRRGPHAGQPRRQSHLRRRRGHTDV